MKKLLFALSAILMITLAACGGKSNDNANDNANDKVNVNANDNANDKVNVNANDNANDKVNVNANDNANDKVNDKVNVNANVNANDNANDNIDDYFGKYKIIEVKGALPNDFKGIEITIAKNGEDIDTTIDGETETAKKDENGTYKINMAGVTGVFTFEEISDGKIVKYDAKADGISGGFTAKKVD